VQYCPGEVCELKDRQEIQKTTGTQVLVLLACSLLLAGMIYFLNDYFSKVPQDLLDVLKGTK
jgi:hypothetical protein